MSCDNPGFTEVTIKVPMLSKRFDQDKHGYASGRIDCELNGELGDGLRRMLVGCRNAKLQFNLNGRRTHVETGPDLVRYLVSQALASLVDQGE